MKQNNTPPLERMSEFFNNRVDGYEEHQLTAIEGAREFYPFTASLLPDIPGCRVLEKSVTFGDKNQWNAQFDWLIDVMLKMKKAFKKYL